MDLLVPIRKLDAFQRRHAALAIPVAVLRNFSDQGAGNASALIAYWAFFSIFPLLLLFAAVLGFVLADPDQRRGGVAVVDVAALVLAAVHLDDRRVRAKPVDALLHDGAGGHRHLDGAAATGRTLGGDVHALVE